MMSALHRIALLLSAVSMCLLLDSCSSSSSIRGVPKNLPTINLHGSAETPSHGMEKKDYPFDSNGKYMTDWAALGSSPASSSDYDSWRSSHGARSSKKASGAKKYTAAKKSSSSSKKGGSTSKSKGSTVAKSGSSKSKSGSNSGSGTKSKSGSSGGGYVVKSGDTLSTIARRNNTTVAKLKSANGLNSDMIRDGKSLKIPK